MHPRTILLVAAAALCGCSSSTLSSTPSEASQREQGLIDDSTATLDKMAAEPAFASALKNSAGVMIFPKVVKAALLVGGGGGKGVLLAKDNRGWSAPAFYKIGGGTAGVQVGYDEVAMVLVFNNKQALYKATEKGLNLGADATVAAGKTGATSQVSAQSDITTFAQAKGVFAGVAGNGMILNSEEDYNRAMYGTNASAKAIVVDHHFDGDARAKALRSKLESLSGMPVAMEKERTFSWFAP
jgi:lipid-binding SYLF domain-containing protein